MRLPWPLLQMKKIAVSFWSRVLVEEICLLCNRDSIWFPFYWLVDLRLVRGCKLEATMSAGKVSEVAPCNILNTSYSQYRIYGEGLTDVHETTKGVHVDGGTRIAGCLLKLKLVKVSSWKTCGRWKVAWISWNFCHLRKISRHTGSENLIEHLKIGCWKLERRKYFNLFVVKG